MWFHVPKESDVRFWYAAVTELVVLLLPEFFLQITQATSSLEQVLISKK